jgi:hypothetical protein
MSEAVINILSSSVGVLLAILMGIFGAMIPILKDWVETNWKKRFHEQLEKAVVGGELIADDVVHLAERWNQDRRSVLFSLRQLLADSVSKEKDDLKDSMSMIRELIAWHAEREPFSELPENIGIQLNTLKLDFPQSESNIGQLAASLNELYAMNKAELKKQKLYSFWGFLVGFIGLLLTIAGLYFALTANV